MRVHARGPKKPNRTDIEVGRRISTQRVARGLTQGELAEAIGVIAQQVQKYESGADRISISRLARIARILRVGVPYLLHGGGRAVPAIVRSRGGRAKLNNMLRPAGARRLLKAFAEIPADAHELRDAIVRLVEGAARRGD